MPILSLERVELRPQFCQRWMMRSHWAGTYANASTIKAQRHKGAQRRTDISWSAIFRLFFVTLCLCGESRKPPGTASLPTCHRQNRATISPSGPGSPSISRASTRARSRLREGRRRKTDSLGRWQVILSRGRLDP